MFVIKNTLSNTFTTVLPVDFTDGTVKVLSQDKIFEAVIVETYCEGNGVNSTLVELKSETTMNKYLGDWAKEMSRATEVTFEGNTLVDIYGEIGVLEDRQVNGEEGKAFAVLMKEEVEYGSKEGDTKTVNFHMSDPMEIVIRNGKAISMRHVSKKRIAVFNGISREEVANMADMEQVVFIPATISEQELGLIPSIMFKTTFDFVTGCPSKKQ